MNSQIKEIYLDVLKEGLKIFIIKKDGNKYHIITYLPWPPMMELLKNGYDIGTALSQTHSNHYILQDEH